MKDVHNNIKAQRVFSPAALTATATGKVIDRQGYEGVEFIISYGAIAATGATITPVIKHGDVTGTMTSVADSDLLGTESAAGIAAGARTSGSTSNVTKRIGYIGDKRYVQCVLLNTGVTGLIGGVDVILAHPALSPVAT